MRSLLVVAVLLVCHPLCAWSSEAPSGPLTIDLTHEVQPVQPVELGQGTNRDPRGHVLTADSLSLFLDGKPFVPIVGEFHYSRYPREDWRDELLKMKAGGLDTVSTYVFWIHHEEERGKFDWSGRRSLRDFLQLCQEVGLKAVVRLGPWDHGEVRNGGFPDWVQDSGTKLRTTDPAYLKLVLPFYQEIADQMHGFLWKDGGPVIAVQVDNECNNAPYLLALKKMAQSVGIDVPFYTMTGWDRVAIPQEGLLPVFGGYPVGFWSHKAAPFRPAFLFSSIRDQADLGAQLARPNSNRSPNIGLFPYVCAEIGGGMMSSYQSRIQVVPDDVAALAMTRLGCGNNMPGYYMYQGGINPDGKLSYLNEDQPNAMPVKDYDFEAPLGACGEVRDQFHLLRLQHFFLQDFGETLARMPAYFPDVRPAGLEDFSVLRWGVRSDGKSGFLFFGNRQPTVPLPAHPGVQFSVRTTGGSLLVPRRPIDVPSGSYGFWPLNLDCDGVTLEYATVQPLLRFRNQNDIWYFFTAINGIAPEMSFVESGLKVAVTGHVLLVHASDHLYVDRIKPGLNRAVGFTKPDGNSINFVVLANEQAKQLYRPAIAGHPQLILSKATVLEDGSGLRLLTYEPKNLSFAAFPALPGVQTGGAPLNGNPDGIFQRYQPVPASVPSAVTVTADLKTPAGPAATQLEGTKEETWKDAEVWQLHVPPEAVHRHLLLQINYTGDAVRLYAGDQFVDDNYYHGDPLDVGLWRIPAGQLSNLRLEVLPYSDGLLVRLPDNVRAAVKQAKDSPGFGKVTVTVREEVDLPISANSR